MNKSMVQYYPLFIPAGRRDASTDIQIKSIKEKKT